MSFHALAKGHKGDVSQLEMLLAKGYSNNCYAQQHAPEDMRQAYPEASDDNPYHIHQHTDATAAAAAHNNMTAERPQGKHAKFERLYAKRYADDGYHQH